MNFLRNHWFDIGIVPACCVIAYLFFKGENFSNLNFILWFNFASLFFHQFEEYRFPGYFPGMLNVVLFKSKMPDRYPLNTNSALIVNVFLGWLIYLLAAVLGEKFLWLAIGAALISAGNFFAHTILFNIKAKAFYNPGLVTSVFLFLPGVSYFFYLIIHFNLCTTTDYITGFILGFIFNYFGIIKVIEWMKDTNTKYIFPARCLPPKN